MNVMFAESSLKIKKGGKLKFCIGNEDFSDLCCKIRNENLAVFYGRDDEIIADKVMDVICKLFKISSTLTCLIVLLI